jgi:manganese/zinc/iron transport system substrate-binding protein
MMWKKFTVFLCVALCLSCQELVKIQTRTKEWMANDGKVKILCTTAFVGSLVRSVGGDAVDVLDLISGPNDPHSYQLVKGDDEKFRRADVVFCSGLGLEAGSTVRAVLGRCKACSIGDAIAQTSGQAIITDSAFDPHMWMDVSLWAQGVAVIERRLAEARPELNSVFHKNALATHERLLHLHEKILAKMLSLPQEQRYLVTTHDAFQYFCRAYLSTWQEQRDGSWKRRCMAPEGLSPESQMSTRDLRATVAYIHEHGIRRICVEEGMNQDSVLKVIDVCKAQGDDVAFSCNSVFSDTMGPGMTYEETMVHNANTIFQALEAFAKLAITSCEVPASGRAPISTDHIGGTPQAGRVASFAKASLENP